MFDSVFSPPSLDYFFILLPQVFLVNRVHLFIKLSKFGLIVNLLFFKSLDLVYRLPNGQIIVSSHTCIVQKMPPLGLVCSGDNYPDWLTFNSNSSSVTFEVPQGTGVL
jgi:hypothetical protein